MERGSREMMVSCCLRPRLLVSLFAHWKGPLRSLKYSKRCCVKFMSRSTFCKLLCFHVQKFYWTKNMKVEGIMCFTAGVMVNCFFRSQNFWRLRLITMCIKTRWNTVFNSVQVARRKGKSNLRKTPTLRKTEKKYTVYTSQKPFYSQPNYPSLWLGIFWCAFRAI